MGLVVACHHVATDGHAVQRDAAMLELHDNMRAEHETGLVFVAGFFKNVRHMPLGLPAPSGSECTTVLTMQHVVWLRR